MLFALLDGLQNLVDDFDFQPACQPAFEEADMHQGAGAQPSLAPHGGVSYPPSLAKHANKFGHVAAKQQ